MKAIAAYFQKYFPTKFKEVVLKEDAVRFKLKNKQEISFLLNELGILTEVIKSFSDYQVQVYREDLEIWVQPLEKL